MSLFLMKKQRDALKKLREKKKYITKIRSNTIIINHNNYIQQNFERPSTPIHMRDCQTSPIPKQTQSKSPIFQEMISNALKSPKGRRWSVAFLIFSMLIYFYSPTAYSILREQTPLPAVSTVYNLKNSLLLDKEENLLSAQKLPKILKLYEDSNSIDNSSSKIQAIIAVDAVSVVPSNKVLKNGTLTGILNDLNISRSDLDDISNSYQKFEELMINNSKNIVKAAFVFQIQPINHSIPCFLIHVIPSNSGKANQDILLKLFELKDIIEKNNHFSIIGFAADGDNSYRRLLEFQISNENDMNNVLFFSDYLHLLKRSRYWFLKCLEKNTSNVNEFKNKFCLEYNLPSIVMSNERITKMHDSLPLKLFDTGILLKSVELQHNHIFKFIFPWSLFMFSLNNDHIPFKNRYKYLMLCKAYFNRFPMFYDKNLLIDIKGTIISLLKIFKMEKEKFSLSRLSTNPLEHSFGILRMKARNHDTIDKFINDIKRLNFIRLHKKEYFETVIRHRVSNFGKIINPDSNFCNNSNLDSLLDSIERFISKKEKNQLFDNFINEIKDLYFKESPKNSDIICGTKDITISPSSQGKRSGRQEMDHTGRKYCPWTKGEEEKLIMLKDIYNGNINKIMKYFPERSPDSIRQKIRNLDKS